MLLIKICIDLYIRNIVFVVVQICKIYNLYGGYAIQEKSQLLIISMSDDLSIEYFLQNFLYAFFLDYYGIYFLFYIIYKSNILK